MFFESVKFSIQNHPRMTLADQISGWIRKIYLLSLVKYSWIIICILLRAHEMKLNRCPFIKHFNFPPRRFSIIAHFKENLALQFIENLCTSLLHVVLNLLLDKLAALNLVIGLDKELFGLHELSGEFFNYSFLRH